MTRCRCRCGSSCKTPLPVPPPQGGREPEESVIFNISAAMAELAYTATLRPQQVASNDGGHHSVPSPLVGEGQGGGFKAKLHSSFWDKTQQLIQLQSHGLDDFGAGVRLRADEGGKFFRRGAGGGLDSGGQKFL